jgi:hypothetical protein
MSINKAIIIGGKLLARYQILKIKMPISVSN